MLILFDIDGTLLRCGPQIRPIFGGALREVYGDLEPIGDYEFSGKTDQRIILDLVGRDGRPEEEIKALFPAMQSIYFERLENGLDVDQMQLLPGVQMLLDRYAERDDVTVGLLTGNWQRGAEIKLSRFNLGRYFSFGAFGDDAVHRRALVPIALERAAQTTGRTFSAARTLIIGDAVADVDCALANGAVSLAVTTGFTTADRLKDAGADWIFANLEEAADQGDVLP